MFKWLTKINFQKIKHYALAHKVITTMVVLVVLVGGYYTVRALTNSTGTPQYVLAQVRKGTIVSAVEGTGQVSADHQIDLKTKASGDIVYVGAVTGQVVGAGTLIAQVNARDAALALESAKLNLAKLTKPADETDLTKAKNDLLKAEGDGFSDVVSAFVDLPTVLNDLDDFLNGPIGSEEARQSGRRAQDYRDAAVASFYQAKTSQRAALAVYKTVTRESDVQTLASLVVQTYDTTKDLAQALKDTKTAYDYIQNDLDWPTSNPDRDNLVTWIGTIGGHLTALLADQSTITQATNDLEDLVQGADELDIKSEQLNVQEKINAYTDAFVRAPFAGQIARLDVRVGDTVSNGTTVGVFITKQKIAEISLNEVDVAHVKTGQKATLTFDAVPDLTITGAVVEVDLVGTEDQGVVNYGVKIGFDTQDERIKSGMSVNASVITDTKTDVLVVPVSAVKSQNGKNYVLVFNPALSLTASSGPVTTDSTPHQQPVVVGLTNDTRAEIISGLTEGEQFVVRTVSASAAAATASAPSIFGGGNRPR